MKGEENGEKNGRSEVVVGVGLMPKAEQAGTVEVEQYFEQGFKVLLLHREKKRPVGKEWQRRPGLTREEALEAVSRGDPIGLQVGQVSGDLACIDHDVPEAVKLAPFFLPPTLKAAKGGEVSHYVYRCPGLGYAAFDDLDQSRLIDIKASKDDKGHIFVVAPSVHRTKGPYEWVGGFDPDGIQEASAGKLREAVGYLAAAVLIARHLPDKGRHNYSLALSGYLLRNGIRLAEVGKILRGSWWCAGAPGEGLEAAGRNAEDTAEKVRLGEPAIGGKVLEELVPGMPRRLAKFLEFGFVAEEEAQAQALSSVGLGPVAEIDLKRSIQAISFRGRAKPGPRVWVVENHVAEGYAASWYGEGGVAKSYHSAHLGLCVAHPEVRTWHGHKITTAPVLVLDFELDTDEHHRRVNDLVRGLGWNDAPEDYRYLPLAGLGLNAAFEIAAGEAKATGAKLVIVDSVGFALDGDAELSKDVLRFHKTCIQPLRDAGASPLMLDHQSKIVKGEKYGDKKEFGSVYKGNAVRSSFQLRAVWYGNETTTTFTHQKHNFTTKQDPFSVKLCFGAGRITATRLEEAAQNPDHEPPKKEQVLAAFDEAGCGTADQIAKKSGIKISTVKNKIPELLEEGLLEDTEEKVKNARVLRPKAQTNKGPGPGLGTDDGIQEAF